MNLKISTFMELAYQFSNINFFDEVGADADWSKFLDRL